jgi:predicted ATP-dependent endonuclease of OLD family
VIESESHQNKTDVLPGLSHVNVFVGQNNAGKSRFLRQLFQVDSISFRATFQKDFFDQLKSYRSAMGQIIVESGYNEFKFLASGQHLAEIKKENFLEMIDEFNLSDVATQNYINSMKKMKEYVLGATQLRYSSRSGGTLDDNQILTLMKQTVQEHDELFARLENIDWREGNFDKYYIPTLRSLNNFENVLIDPDNFFKKHVMQSYDLTETTKHKIFTGLDLYDRLQKMLLGERELRDRVHEFEVFLSENLFDGAEIVLVPRLEDKKVLYVGIDGKEREIYNFGDGVQALILLTFPMFEDESAQYFIEEPELHLHPGMQRKLIQAMKNHPQHQFFVTTHSNHFLDLTLESEDVSLYTVTEGEEKKNISLVSFGDESALQLLGAQNTSVYITNSSVWVEGVTDRLYIRKYLELYQKDKEVKVAEDVDFSFVEYGGDNITHWSFLDQEESPINVDRLCGKSILIADQDDAEKKLERKAELKKNLGNRFMLLDCIEIENTLPLETIFEVVKQYEVKNGGTLDEKKLDELTQDDLSAQRVGEFIHEKFFGNKNIFKRKGGYKENSGTVKSKSIFCKKAIENLETLTPQAEKIAKKVYDFIIANRV